MATQKNETVEQRQARLAKALRANLKRRKAQARKRVNDETPDQGIKEKKEPRP